MDEYSHMEIGREGLCEGNLRLPVSSFIPSGALLTTLCNFNFWHTLPTFDLAGNGTRSNNGSHCYSTSVNLSTKLFNAWSHIAIWIDTPLVMWACCNWQHFYFCQIEGAGSIPVAHTTVLTYFCWSGGIDRRAKIVEQGSWVNTQDPFLILGDTLLDHPLIQRQSGFPVLSFIPSGARTVKRVLTLSGCQDARNVEPFLQSCESISIGDSKTHPVC